jgi:hypothetical protein
MMVKGTVPEEKKDVVSTLLYFERETAGVVCCARIRFGAGHYFLFRCMFRR